MIGYYLLLIIIVVIAAAIESGTKTKSRNNRKTNKGNRYRRTYPIKKYDRNKIRGEIGEQKIYQSLLEKIPGDKYILTNLYTLKEHDRRNEIDVILIHTTGFYVIESKNYTGYIYGSRYQKNWYQTYYTKNKKISKPFYSPIYQNEGHIHSLQEMLGTNNKNYFKSYIAFGNDAHIKRILYADNQLRITNYNNIINHIIDDISQKPNIFTKDQIELYYYKLKPFCHKNDDITEKHIYDSKKDNLTRV